MTVRWYWWSSKKGFPVTFHLQRTHLVIWRRIHGLQLGGWFFGVVRSYDVGAEGE